MYRFIDVKSLSEAIIELQKINVSSQGQQVMSPKCLGKIIKLTNISTGAANILKQEMLTIGGDTAISRGVIEGNIQFSDVLLLGGISKYQKLIKRLKFYKIHNLPEIKNSISSLLETPIKKFSIQNRNFNLSKPVIMGILNVTPDSFSDGNNYLNPEKAVKHALKLIADGAEIIDIGGESSRPGASSVSESEELSRVIPVIKALRKKSDIVISLDTNKSVVAQKGIEAGVNIINDISALTYDSKMIDILKNNSEIPIILMHMKGTPKTMQINPYYENSVDEILTYFENKISICEKNGISKNRIIIDPGIGFGKRQIDNLTILKKLGEFNCFGVPVLLGASRKSFIEQIYKSKPDERIAGTLATTALSFQNNIAFIRVHDVKKNSEFIKSLDAIRNVK